MIASGCVGQEKLNNRFKLMTGMTVNDRHSNEKYNSDNRLNLNNGNDKSKTRPMTRRGL